MGWDGLAGQRYDFLSYARDAVIRGCGDGVRGMERWVFGGDNGKTPMNLSKLLMGMLVR